MKNILIALMIMVVSSVYAENYQTVFSKLERDFAGTILGYRKANVPGNTSNKSLVIYLHGGSSCGTDNETQLNEAGIDSISNYLINNNMNAVFVVPQCPDRTKGWGGIAKNVKALLDFTARTEGVDTCRIYIFGGSMGGTGTWKMLSLYPDYFAAAMPCAANPSGMIAENVATTPVYNVMGLADKIMDADVRIIAEDFIEQLQTLGDDTKYETVEGWTHEMTCIQSYSAERLNWVFNHHRETNTAINNITNVGNPHTSIFNIYGVRLTSAPAQGIYIENGIKKMK